MNATAPYEKLKIPVAVYDSTSPAATSEKMAPVMAPLTVRLRNFSTAGCPSGGVVRQVRAGGSQGPAGSTRPTYFLTALG